MDTIHFHPRLEMFKDAAREGGEMLRYLYEQDIQVQYKEDGTEVTNIDKDISNCLISRLRFSDTLVLSEEKRPKKIPEHPAHVILIDPVDGTSNLKARNQEVSIMISQADWDESISGLRIRMGVIYQPFTNTLYFAERGKGAYKEENGKIIRLYVQESLLSADQTTAIIGRSRDIPPEQNFLSILKVRNTIRSGSLGLRVMKVIEEPHTFHLYNFPTLHHHDIGAPQIIFEEALGVVTDMKGNPISYDLNMKNTKGAVFAPHILHQKILRAIRSQLLMSIP